VGLISFNLVLVARIF